MQLLNLKTTHKPIQQYYKSLQTLDKLGVANEMGLKGAFVELLKACCTQFNWHLLEEQSLKINQKLIRPDGIIVRLDTLKHGYWEAKDIQDNLEAEIKRKFAQGYPKSNIMFWQPKRLVLYQNNQLVFDQNLDNPENLVTGIKLFFEYTQPEIENWDQAASEFGSKVKDLAQGLLTLIAQQHKTNPRFKQAFIDFTNLCRSAINPNISSSAVEEMLIQHLLTERIFRKLFNNPDFVRRNVIAAEIEKVINALTSQAFNRDSFLGNVDYFYTALENAASTIKDFAEKQSFLNTVYERFFQGFSVKVADTHGIVYTPQEIVTFMVRSVEEILQREFGKSLSDRHVSILDPFVGTGNFILKVMENISKTALSYKYQHDLHCNEVMLLPYYIACLNIEHQYYQLTGQYQPFEGICLVDTFETVSAQQLSLFTEENTARVEKQKNDNIFVIIGNPPYNVGQVNENDNNKNRKYAVMDSRVAETYSKDSKATNKNALSDPYIKALRWATDRIKSEGIIALVTNNSFIDDIAFDGVRKHLAQEFDEVYILDLGGNVRKNPKLSGTTHNIFGIQVGVSINIFLRKNQGLSSKGKIYYTRMDECWTRVQKSSYLAQNSHIYNLPWQEIQPDKKYTWLTDGLESDFDSLIPLGSKETKAKLASNQGAIFINYSRGAETARDTWAYNFSTEELTHNMLRFIDTYNEQVRKWHTQTKKPHNLDDFVCDDEQKIKWSSRLKECLLGNISVEFETQKIRHSIYRPFTAQYLYFDEVLTHRRGQFPYIFPTAETENQVICVSGVGSNKPFQCLAVSVIPCLDMLEKTQCFPYYIYDEDGNNRTENISDWTLSQFQSHYNDNTIQKWEIFYYIYAILHHSDYRQRYAVNLRRELPRIPFAPEFWAFAHSGKLLADLHINYEQAPEYPLKFIENPDEVLNWRVEKMKLTADKTQIIYNNFLTLGGIPDIAFLYRLGNKSALEWVIDQYVVSTDKRSGISSDPNRPHDEQYIRRLIAQIITVSLETVAIVDNLPSLFDGGA